MPTVDELREVSLTRRPKLDSYRNCGAINREIASAIEFKYPIQVGVEIGSISTRELRGFGPEHAFVVVHADDIDNYNYRKPLIIDGALDQFCREHKESGRVSLSIAPKSEFDTVEVLTPDDNWYNLYTNWNSHEYY